MHNTNFTDHACLRIQQNGIPRSVLECLLGYDKVEIDHHGGAIVYLNKTARRCLKREHRDAPVRS